MISYDAASLDGADPTYAPGLKREGDRFVWVAPAKYRKAGYKANRQRLPMTDDLDRARLCREYTREMLRWWQGLDVPQIKPNTFGWLARRYLTDDFSPFQDIKANSQRVYRNDVGYWEAAIGDSLIADMGLEQVKRLQRAMKDRGRSVDFIHRKFHTLRKLAKYGVALKNPACRDLADVLSGLRLQAPLPRNIAATSQQIMAVVAQADAHGHHSFALGILLQWWLALRAMDVRGDYFDIKAGESKDGGIVVRNTRWGSGLTWAEVAPDLSCITKVISKTERHDARPVRFDLSELPDLRNRLARLEHRVGPVIVNPRTGLPFNGQQWRDLWRQFADKAGVPTEVQLRDARAGAITEANSMGATEEMTMHQGTHTKASTTQRYIRNRDQKVAEVIALRAGTKVKP